MMSRWTWRRALIAVGIVISAGGLVFVSAVEVGGLVKRRVIAGLEERLESKVEFENTQVGVFPRVHVSIEKLVLRHRGRTDIPPLMTMEKLTLTGSIVGLLRTPRRLSSARIEGLQIRTPPKGQNPSPETTKAVRTLPAILIDEVIADDALLQTLPSDPRKFPREFKIHRVVIRSFGFDRAASFHALLTNPTPVGEIDSEGQFGPWNADEPGDTPVSGTFRFSHADFATLRGITGILSSEGSYRGALNHLDVEGHTQTPDFALAAVGNTIPLTTHYVAVVDGTNGDTYLTSVEARLGDSTILATGKVVGIPGIKGRHIFIEANSQTGRIEDMLRLTVKGEQPPMMGSVNLVATIDLPPGEEDLLDRLVLFARFGVAEGRFTSQGVQEKLDSLSRRGQGQPKDESIQNVISNVRGRLTVRQGTVTFSSLAFDVPGATVQLSGSYNLRSEVIDFHGHLLLDAKISQTTTGAKSFVLRLFDPFFNKDGGGASLPIKITGERKNLDFGLDLF
jgi:hypothetical protein